MFIICANCRRHVRSTDSACPFCNHRNFATRRFRTGLAVALGVSSSIACGAAEQNDSAQTGGNVSTGGTTGTITTQTHSSPNGGSSPTGGSGGTSATTPSTTSSSTAAGGSAYGVPPTGGRSASGGAYGVPPTGGSHPTGGSSASGGQSTGGLHAGGSSGTATGGMFGTAYGVPPSGGHSNAGGYTSATSGTNTQATNTSGGAASYGVPPTGGRSGLGGAYGVPPSGGAGGKPATMTTLVSQTIECRTESGVTGWFSGGELICEASCKGCTATCQAIGSRSEGWYTSCAAGNAGCGNGGLIAWANCGDR